MARESCEGDIRRALVDADIVNCMVSATGPVFSYFARSSTC
jgi:hypothetical protein